MHMIKFVLFIVYSIALLVAGYLGIDHHLGILWAILAIAAALIFRFTLPITIGAFFGAMDVWQWHWMVAAAFAVPALIFLVPGVIMSIIKGVRRHRP